MRRNFVPRKHQQKKNRRLLKMPHAQFL
jgi:hypothetical protein